jgi:hypothetical protein
MRREIPDRGVDVDARLIQWWVFALAGENVVEHNRE